MNWHLKNKKALVTGGTKGLGLAIVEEFLSLGAEVFLVARNQTEIDNLLNKLQARGNAVDGMAGDMSEGEARKKVIDTLSARWGSLDILVNNVGTNIRRRFIEYTEEEYRRLFDINLFSLTEMCRLAHPLLAKGNSASVINMASIAGWFDIQSGPPYGMTKAAIIQFTRHLAVEWAEHNIRVNSVSPVVHYYSAHGAGICQSRPARKNPRKNTDEPRWRTARSCQRRSLPGHGSRQLHHRSGY